MPTHSPRSDFSRRAFGALAGTALFAAPAIVRAQDQGQYGNQDRRQDQNRNQNQAGMQIDPRQAAQQWTNLIAQEHRQVEQLFQQIAQSKANDVQRRSDLRMQLADLLTLHGLREENVIYPALRGAGQNWSAMELFNEHADIKTHLNALEVMDHRNEEWMERVRDFQEEVVTHAREEEQEIFPELVEDLSPDQHAFIWMAVQRVGNKFQPGNVGQQSQDQNRWNQNMQQGQDQNQGWVRRNQQSQYPDQNQNRGQAQGQGDNTQQPGQR